jgi:hypothetical protein
MAQLDELAAEVRRRATRVASGEWLIERDGVTIQASHQKDPRYPRLRIWFPYGREQPIAMAKATQGAAPYREGTDLRPVYAIRPLAIVLRAETEYERDGKQKGVDREFQTGDARFDESVYVDTSTEDAVLARLLEPAPVRAAIGELVSLECLLTVDDEDGNVIAVWSEAPKSLVEANDQASVYAVRAIGAMLTLARDLPVVASSGAVRRDRVETWTKRGLVVALVLSFLSVFFVIPGLAPHACIDHERFRAGLRWTWRCTGSPVAGGFLGVVLGAIAARSVTHAVSPKLSGRSDSSSRVFAAGMIAFLVTANLAMIVGALVGWRLWGE